jgi:hypothetical protein
MVKILIGIAGLAIGLIVGFWLGTGQTVSTPELAAASRARETAGEEPARPPVAQAERHELTRASTTATSSRVVDPVGGTATPPSDDDPLPDGMVRGIVVDTAGHPFPFVTISADLVEPESGQNEPGRDPSNPVAPWHVETRATRTGRFALAGLRRGVPYLVRTHCWNLVRTDVGRAWQVDERQIVAPAEDVKLTLTQCRLEVEIIDPHGRSSLPNAEVIASVSGAQPGRFDGQIDCRFAIGVPPDRAVRLEIRAADLQTKVLDDLVVPAAEATRRVTVPMTAITMSTVWLTIRDEAGRPQTAAYVADITESGHRVDVAIDWKHSNREQGVFVLDKLPAGRHVLLVRGPPDGELVPARIEVEALEAVEVSVDVTLRLGGRLRVAVSGNGDSFACVHLYTARGRMESSFHEEGTHRDVGDQLLAGTRYVFERALDPGAYVLSWQRGSRGSSRGPGGESITYSFVRPGPTNETSFTVSAGELKDLEVKLE